MPRDVQIVMGVKLISTLIETTGLWDQNQRGGCLFSLCARYPLVRRSSRKIGGEVAARWMPTVYLALNRIQGTAFADTTELQNS